MKRFFKNLFIFCAFAYGTLFLLQYLVDSGLQKTFDNDYGDWNSLLEGKIKDPMVFLGSSRADCHFDPILIQQKTGIPSYNLGFPAASLRFQRIKWKSYLEHNNPKIVIQNIDLHALWDKNGPDKKSYLPYYNDTVLFDELEKTDHTVSIEKWIPMSKYRGFEEVMLKGIRSAFGKKFSRDKIKGYHRHEQSWNSDFEIFKKANNGKPDYSDYDFASGITELKELINDCKQRKAKLILVWTPAYYELNELQEPYFSKMKAEISTLAQQNNIPFWDFSNGVVSRDKKYFYNAFHMNNKGVAHFCSQFSDSLNVYLKNPIP